jgi:hypothetical protein
MLESIFPRKPAVGKPAAAIVAYLSFLNTSEKFRLPCNTRATSTP